MKTADDCRANGCTYNDKGRCVVCEVPPAKTGAERAKAHRERGKSLAVTLTDKQAIKALARLVRATGSQRAAIEYALREAAVHLKR